MKPPFKELPAIIKRLADTGSESAYEKLFNELYHPVKKFAFCMLHSNEAASEVADEVLITLWNKKKALTEINNVHVFALIIARNLSLNILRKNAKSKISSLDEIEVSFFFDNPGQGQVIIDKELKKRLEDAIQSLPPRCQLVFKLAAENGLSYREIGEVLSLSVRNVDALLLLATASLAKIFKEEFQIKS